MFSWKHPLNPCPIAAQRATTTNFATAVCSNHPSEPFYEWYSFINRKFGRQPQLNIKDEDLILISFAASLIEKVKAQLPPVMVSATQKQLQSKRKCWRNSTHVHYLMELVEKRPLIPAKIRRKLSYCQVDIERLLIKRSKRWVASKLYRTDPHLHIHPYIRMNIYTQTYVQMNTRTFFEWIFRIHIDIVGCPGWPDTIYIKMALK